ARTLRNVMVGIFFIRLIGKSLLALRGRWPGIRSRKRAFPWAQSDKGGPESQTRALGLRGRARKFSITDPQEVLPLSKVALEAHACDNPEARDDAPLNFLAGLASGFACSPTRPD